MYNKGEKNMKTLVEQMALIQSLNEIGRASCRERV